MILLDSSIRVENLGCAPQASRYQLGAPKSAISIGGTIFGMKCRKIETKFDRITKKERC